MKGYMYDSETRRLNACLLTLLFSFYIFAQIMLSVK